jgi:Family of unknown function (DUF6518)
MSQPDVIDAVASLPARDRRRVGWLATIAIAAVAGFVLGCLTQILQGLLPADAGTILANSGAAWACAALGVGMLMSSDGKAAVAGAITLVVAAFTFYEAVSWFENVSSGSTGAVVWSLAGLVAGPVFGIVGRWARAHPTRRPFALALVAGVLIAEGLFLIFWVGVDNLWSAGLVEVVIGTSVGVYCMATAHHRAAVLGLIVAAAFAQRVAYEILDRLFQTL